MSHFTDRPLAASPLKSYRYKGRFGFVMIGAVDNQDALREAERSIDKPALLANLERYEDGKYRPA